ncbi:MAG: GspH/FimT family protein [Deltaproteobacteria bacterium]|nr:GspH/FimT family protein [Deltaproteobacteria bacterium]
MRSLFTSQTIKGNSGFTMVELIVVVVILTLVIGIGVPTYHLTIKPTAHLNGAARQLYSAIQLARLRAVSRNVRCGMVLSTGPSYTLFVDDNPANSKYEYTDDGDDTNDEEVIKAFDLGNEYPGVQFDTSQGGGDGISFVNNSFAMTPRGVPTRGGTLYLKNEKGEGRKIVVNNMGGARLEKYGSSPD